MRTGFASGIQAQHQQSHLLRPKNLPHHLGDLTTHDDGPKRPPIALPVMSPMSCAQWLILFAGEVSFDESLSGFQGWMKGCRKVGGT